MALCDRDLGEAMRGRDGVPGGFLRKILQSTNVLS